MNAEAQTLLGIPRTWGADYIIIGCSPSSVWFALLIITITIIIGVSWHENIDENPYCFTWLIARMVHMFIGVTLNLANRSVRSSIDTVYILSYGILVVTAIALIVIGAHQPDMLYFALTVLVCLDGVRFFYVYVCGVVRYRNVVTETPSGQAAGPTESVAVYIPTSTTEESCIICMDTYDGGGEIIRLNCLHHYHKHCLYRWIMTQRNARIKPTCPCCCRPLNIQPLII